MLEPETPSTEAWCILENTAILPFARPSMTCISQSGRDLSSGMPGKVARDLGQLTLAARGRRGEPVDVPVDVELVVGHPDGEVDAARHELELAVEHRDARDALGQLLLEPAKS